MGKKSLDLSEAARLLATDITLAVEFLMTAQRAILRGHSASDNEVTEPLKWAMMQMGATK